MTLVASGRRDDAQSERATMPMTRNPLRHMLARPMYDDLPLRNTGGSWGGTGKRPLIEEGP